MVAARNITIGVKLRPEAQIKAEALREAADDWYGDDGAWDKRGSEATWLRERADRLEGITSEETPS